MQQSIRQYGNQGMTKEDVEYFTELYTRKKLESPEKIANIVAILGKEIKIFNISALYAPKQFSGEFLSYSDSKIKELVDSVEHPRVSCQSIYNY